MRFSGIDKAAISESNDYGYGCILSVYEKNKARLSADNICISDTTVRPGKDRYLFDYNAVNEAVLNALVHNITIGRLQSHRYLSLVIAWKYYHTEDGLERKCRVCSRGKFSCQHILKITKK